MATTLVALDEAGRIPSDLIPASTVIGTASGYPVRPDLPNVRYIGPTVPTDWLTSDTWTDTSGAGSGG